MAGVNKVILLGNLGKDPEVRHLDTGRAVANFPIATSETYKNRNGERVTNTEWHNIVLWTPLAEIAEKYLKKGNQVYIEGKITTRSYDDKDGIKKYITEVVGRELTLLGSKSDTDNGYNQGSSSNEGRYQPTNSEVDSSEEETDDLPF